jgi:ribose transport system substrate-binding protein
MKKFILLLSAIVFFECIVAEIAIAVEKEWSRSFLWNPNPMKIVDTSKYKKNPPYTIAYANVAVSNSYGVFTVLEFKARAEKYKDMIKNIFVTDAQDRPDKQISDIEDLVSKGVDALVIRAATEAALDPIVTRLHPQGIPVICFARRVKSDNFVSFVTTSLRAQGRMQAVWLAQMLKGKGNIVILMGMAGSGSTEERKRAFYETLQFYPGIKVLDDQYTKYSAAEGKKIMAAMIQSYGKQINGVLTDCGLQGRGVIEAMQEAGLKVPITGDLLNGFMTRVQKWGYPACAVSYPPSLAGDSVDVAVKVLQGIPVAFEYEMPRIITTTVDTPDVKADIPWKKLTYLDKSDDYWCDHTLPAKWLPK